MSGLAPAREKRTPPKTSTMKKLITLTVLGLAASVRAQVIVYDPTINMQEIIAQIENAAKYAQMIDNQVQQMNILSSQLVQLEQYNAAFGDPARIVLVTGVPELVIDLQHPPVGQPLIQLQLGASGAEALSNDGNGLYHNVGLVFTTPSGQQVTRVANDYKPIAAIDGATQNFTNVYADVRLRRAALKADIAATAQRLQAATTDAEVQKLQGVLTALNADLAATDQEVDQAVGTTLVQQAQNQNDEAKQAQARAEEQQAEFTESLQNYRTKFKLSAESANFPDSQ
jgi:hypothetical protein